MVKNIVSICLTFGVILSAVSTARVNVIDIYRKEVFEYAVIRNYKPVVVFFTGKSTCSPCQGVLSNLEEFAKENNDKIYLAVVDLDKQPQLKDAFDISIVPTTRTYYKGKLMEEFKGPVWPSIKYVSSKLLKIK